MILGRNKIIFWLAFLASCVLFFAPFTVEQPGGLGIDKLVHAAVFGILLALAFRAYRDHQMREVIFLVIYAYAIEIMQGSFLPSRHFDLTDITADLFGIVIALLILVKRQNKSSSPARDRGF